ncbi:unnamed protein product, partial [Hapterophycus canaliculatus]
RRQDERLGQLVVAASGAEIDWDHISRVLDNGRNESQCASRWQRVLHPQTIKGAWTPEEDLKMTELVGLFGPKRWSAISQRFPGRIGKQCRERLVTPGLALDCLAFP